MRLQTIILAGAGIACAVPMCSNNDSSVLQLSTGTITNLQLALFLENLEVAFFNSAISNLTAGDAQYGASFNKTISEAMLQEVVHQQSLKNILAAAGAGDIPPCEYAFPSRNTTEFLSLGRSLSFVGVGASLALADAVSGLDPELVTGLASIAATEARHSAFFESASGRIPNPSPFDTPISGTWAYNLALSFIVSGSCQIEPPFPILPVLNAQVGGEENMTNITFSWDPTQQPLAAQGNKPLFIVWLNQLALPMYSSLDIINSSAGSAILPSGLEGPVFAALTAQDSLETVGEVTGSTLAGPTLVLI